ncbi:MAG: hypothetical protein GKR94_24365 [Gammaproteobacteria bacterium]|nr:hypothetical protein [Gammaproteobacteria bacterium]
MSGDLIHLMIASAEDLASWCEIFRECEGPEDLYKIVDECKAIPYFWEQGNRYSKNIRNWERYIFPCKKLDNADLYYSIMKNPEYYMNYRKMVSKYRYEYYLDDLDANVRVAS